MDHTFCVEHNAFGKFLQHELKPNGKNISVTEENKKEYVRYEAMHTCGLTKHSKFMITLSEKVIQQRAAVTWLVGLGGGFRSLTAFSTVNLIE